MKRMKFGKLMTCRKKELSDVIPPARRNTHLVDSLLCLYVYRYAYFQMCAYAYAGNIYVMIMYILMDSVCIYVNVISFQFF